MAIYTHREAAQDRSSRRRMENLRALMLGMQMLGSGLGEIGGARRASAAAQDKAARSLSPEMERRGKLADLEGQELINQKRRQDLEGGTGWTWAGANRGEQDDFTGLQALVQARGWASREDVAKGLEEEQARVIGDLHAEIARMEQAVGFKASPADLEATDRLIRQAEERYGRWRQMIEREPGFFDQLRLGQPPLGQPPPQQGGLAVSGSTGGQDPLGEQFGAPGQAAGAGVNLPQLPQINPEIEEAARRWMGRGSRAPQPAMQGVTDPFNPGPMPQGVVPPPGPGGPKGGGPRNPNLGQDEIDALLRPNIQSSPFVPPGSAFEPGMPGGGGPGGQAMLPGQMAGESAMQYLSQMPQGPEATMADQTGMGEFGALYEIAMNPNSPVEQQMAAWSRLTEFGVPTPAWVTMQLQGMGGGMMA